MQGFNLFMVSLALIIISANGSTTKSEVKELKAQVAELQAAITQQD